MKFLRDLNIVILLFSSQCWADEELSTNLQARYEAAIHSSYPPIFLQFTVSDSNSKTAQEICTSSEFLMGAIRMEHGLDYDALGSKKALEIALSNKSHHFVFSKQSALDNVSFFRPFPDDLEVVRARIKNLSNEELKKGLGPLGNGGLMDQLEQDPILVKHFTRHHQHGGAFRYAFACVLVQRGLQVVKEHGVRLYIDEE